MNKIKFKERIVENLHDIYAYNLSSEEINKLADDIIDIKTVTKKANQKPLTQNDILLITYANTIVKKK